MSSSASESRLASTTEPSTAASRSSSRSAALSMSIRAVTRASMESGVAAPSWSPARINSRRNKGFVTPRSRSPSISSSSAISPAASAAYASERMSSASNGPRTSITQLSALLAKLSTSTLRRAVSNQGRFHTRRATAAKSSSDASSSRWASSTTMRVGPSSVAVSTSTTTSRSFPARFAGSTLSTAGVMGTSAPKAMASSGSHSAVSGSVFEHPPGEQPSGHCSTGRSVDARVLAQHVRDGEVRSCPGVQPAARAQHGDVVVLSNHFRHQP